jgi:hypothetical protein
MLGYLIDLCEKFSLIQFLFDGGSTSIKALVESRKRVEGMAEMTDSIDKYWQEELVGGLLDIEGVRKVPLRPLSRVDHCAERGHSVLHLS